MFLDLPPDVLLTILSLLSLSDVSVLRRTTKHLNQIISENSASIHRSVAIRQFGAPPSIDDLDSLRYPPFKFQDFSPRSISNKDHGSLTWTALCARLNQIRNSWKGKHSSTITIHNNTGDVAVHRFKIDENAGFIIATTKLGGLVVTDLDGPDEGKVLWSLPKSRVRPYAHCEYSHGYLVFDRLSIKEVWRLSDYSYYYPSDPLVTVDPGSQPDEWQLAGAEEACISPLPPVGIGTRRRKGHFTPHATVLTSLQTLMYRLVFPYLVVASFESALVYDIRSCTIIQNLGNIQGPSRLAYVEHSLQHVFVCRKYSLRVFARSSSASGPSHHSTADDGSGKCVFSISTVHDNYGRYRYTIQNTQNNKSRAMNWILGKVPAATLQGKSHTEEDWMKVRSVLYKHNLVRERDRTRKFKDPITAAHVSQCGNYLTILLETSRLLLIRDLHKIVQGRTSLHENTIEIQLGKASRFSKYLAFEYGRVGVANRNGIFIVIPPPTFFSSQFPINGQPTVLRIHPLNDPSVLDCISCLQMTPTGLYVNWSPHCLLANLPRFADAGEKGKENGDEQQRHRRDAYTEQEEVFWNGLKTESSQKYRSDGYLFVNEEDVFSDTMFEESASVVLSVDFVPT